MTPLMVSVALDDAIMMNTLLRYGENACHAGIGDLTPLHIAAGKCGERERQRNRETEREQAREGRLVHG